MSKRLGLAAAVLLSCLPSRAQQPETLSNPELIPPTTSIPKEMEVPTPPEEWYLRWMIHPRRRGMIVSLPVIDTDPNRGTTIGVLPIWIIKEAGGDRIEQMHAPSITYNPVFKFIPTYRYYYYPDTRSAFIARLSLSELLEREVMVEYDTPDLLSKDLDFSGRFQYNVDASNRIFGLGPNSAKSAESDYTEKMIHTNFSIGIPIRPGSKWRAHATSHLVFSERIRGGLTKLPDITNTFPELVAQHRQNTNETHAVLDYDTRDDPTTTGRGTFLQIYGGGAIKGVASEFDFSRYSLDAREFYRWPDHPDWTTAVNYRYEQLLGNVPFWLLPKLGGKYSLRAYGDGRYIDRGMMLWGAEQRYIFLRERMTGVSVEFEAAPFVGLGTVFDNPSRMASRYMRPVLGLAVRAIARPQVVGSVDFGYGQSGLAAFIDINYSF